MMKPCIGVILLAAMASISPAAVVTLDGDQWRLATDPRNVGREEKWFEAPRTNAVGTKVPWIIQDAFPGYHGVAWYWRDFDAPTNPHAGGAVSAAVLGGGLPGGGLAQRRARRRTRGRRDAVRARCHRRPRSRARTNLLAVRVLESDARAHRRAAC